MKKKTTLHLCDEFIYYKHWFMVQRTERERERATEPKMEEKKSDTHEHVTANS